MRCACFPDSRDCGGAHRGHRSGELFVAQISAEAGTGLGGDVVCGDLLAAMGAREAWVGDFAAGVVAQHDRWAARMRQMLVAPPHEGHDRSE